MEMDEPSTSGKRVSVRDVAFVDRINMMLEDAQLSDGDSDVDDPVDDSDADPDYVLSEEEQHEDLADFDDSGDDSSTEEDPEHEVLLNDNNSLPKYIFGRLKKKESGPPYPWCTKEPDRNPCVRTPAHNIFRGRLPGLTNFAKRIGSNPDLRMVWDLIFDPTIIDSIVSNTNVKLASVRLNIRDPSNRSNYRETDALEINALIGLLLLTSVLKSNHETVMSMFSKDVVNRAYFNATMSMRRFEVLLSCLRFDDALTRAQRKANDKAAPISEIFLKVIQNSQKTYSISENATIDEMLIPFRGRCGFRMYMPKKPHKYGIKVMCLADAKTSFLFNAYIYTGKNSDGVGLLPEEQLRLGKPTQSVVRLCKPISRSNRNITADNWFTSLDTTDELEKMGLTYVGTMRKDKREVPKEFLPSRQRPASSARFAINGKRTLVSYAPEKNKSVILISTMHHSFEINEDKKKPEIVCYYNTTKCGVDLLDMRCAVYASNRRTRRWPMAVFYRLLNIGSINSFILYMCFKDTKMMTRFEFTKELGKMLVEPLLRRRLTVPNVRRETKETIKKILGENVVERAREDVPNDKMEKRKTCSKCPSIKERKTQYKCIVCENAICLECSRKVCVDCAKDV